MAVDFGAAVSFYVAVIAIMNPIGNIPIFLNAVNDDPAEVQQTVAKLFGAAVLAIALFFYFVGQPFLALFGITIPAFRIAGGILLMLIGMGMMNGKTKLDADGLKNNTSETNTLEQAQMRLSRIIVPVAMPLFIGPGAITTVILFSQQAQGFVNNLLMILSLTAVCATIAGILYMSRRFANLLGDNGMQIITRSMGLILCAMAVQFVINGIAQLLPGVINPLFTKI